MDNEQLLAFIVAYKLIKKRKQRKRKQCWIRQWVERRVQLGACSTLIYELRLEDPLQLRNFIRMTAVEFEKLMNLIGHQIAKRDTKMREAIPVNDRLMVTLRFLASGESYSSLQYLFRIPPCTIGRIVEEVCIAIYQNLKDEYLKIPCSTEEWKDCADQFERKWNFPHCVGALDGKHVVIQAPKNCGSLYYNYKNSHSIVLMGVADANYKLIYIDVGCNGRVSDGGVFNNCSLYTALEKKQLPLPEAEPLPQRTMPVPYIFVADDAFAMKSYILKPYPFRGQPAPNRIFNYRLSRARRIIENVFGIMSSKFRVLRKPINLMPNKVINVVLAICALHNFLIPTKENYINPGSVDYEDKITHDYIEGEWRKEPPPEGTLFSLERGNRHNHGHSQKDVREEFKEYFMTPAGEVGWQYRFIT